MQKTINLAKENEALILFGHRDRYLRQIRNAFGVKVVARNGTVWLDGPDAAVEKANDVIAELLRIVRETGELRPHEVERELNGAWIKDSPNTRALRVFGRKGVVVPRTPGQEKYVEAVRNNDLVFCVGVAGTGKTYLAVALALNGLKQGLYRKIVLCRPAVEAGERLGFLPGSVQEKVNPYLRPLYDALEDMMEHGQLKRYTDNDVIEVIPLAYMRGRTLNNSFIILDEAQNCTPTQMKMFLTRLGLNSKAVVTGDISQVDLPDRQPSGLVQVWKLLRSIHGIAFVKLTRRDVVRHPLVQEIVAAYERATEAAEPLDEG